MKTYDMTHYLRRLVFGGLLLAAATLLPGCEDDPAVPDEEISTDPGTSAEPETLRFISYNILEGMKLDKQQNFDNFAAWVREKECWATKPPAATVRNPPASRVRHSSISASS